MPELDRFHVAHALASLRSSESDVFGAEAHGFDLNPELHEADLATFERTHGVKLPSDYRAFLMSVGTGEQDRSTASFRLARWMTTSICVIGGKET